MIHDNAHDNKRLGTRALINKVYFSHTQVTRDQLVEIMERQEAYTPESIEFTKRLLAQSGTSDHTAWPPGIVKCLRTDGKRDNTMEASR